MRANGAHVNDTSLRAVLLDVGGTLVESRPSPPEVYAHVFSQLGEPVSGDRVAPVFRRVWTEMTEVHPRGLDRYSRLKGGEREWWGEFLRRVLALLKSSAPWEEALDRLFVAFSEPSLWHVFPDVPTALENLRRRGLRLAVVSNWDSRLPALLTSLGLTGYFDTMVVSALEGVEKPAAEIFLRAARRLQVEPHHCLHVGDSPLDDLRGAESAGVRAVLLDRHGLFHNGYPRITTLEDLDAHLD